MRHGLLGKTLGALGLLCTGALAQTVGNAYTWKPLPFGGGGFVTGFATHKSGAIYARTDVGGAYRWSRDSSEWKPMTDWFSSSEAGAMGVAALATDPRNPNTVYMVGGIRYSAGGLTRLSKSIDGGKTWGTPLDVSAYFKMNGNGTYRNMGGRLAVSPFTSGTLLAGGGMETSTAPYKWGVWLSKDDGKTWTQLTGVPSDQPVSFVAFDPAKSGRMYAALSKRGNKNIYRSDDNGATWTVLSSGTAKTRIGPVVAASNTQYATTPLPLRLLSSLTDSMIPQNYAMTSKGDLLVTFGLNNDITLLDKDNDGAVVRISSAGAWSEITPELRLTNAKDHELRENYSGIAVSPQDDNRISVSTISNSHGVYWQECATCEVRANGMKWSSAAFTTKDGGATWVNQVRSYQPQYLNGVKANGKDAGFPVLAIDPDGPKWAYRNSTISWGANVAFDPLDSGTVFLTGDLGAFRSSTVNTPTTTWVLTKGIEELVVKQIVPIKGGVKLVGTMDIGGFRSPADGSFPLKKFDDPDGHTVALDVADGNPAWVARLGASSTVLHISADTGKTWTSVNRPATATGGKALWNLDGSALLLGQAGLLWRSTDHGTTFAAVASPDVDSCSFLSDPVNAQLVYAYNRTNGIFHVSSDAGKTWTQIAKLQGSISGIAMVPGRTGEFWVGAKTAGFQVYRYSTATKTVSLLRTLGTAKNVTYGGILSFGRGKTSAYPSVFGTGVVNAIAGIFRSDDSGSTWVRVDDDQHQFGGIATIAADPDVYGRLYVGASNGNGLGVKVADLPNTAPSITLGSSWITTSDLSKGFTLFANTLTDLQQNVERVEYFVNGKSIGSSTVGPKYAMTYTSVVWDGYYGVQAKAYDKMGASSLSNSYGIRIPFSYALKAAPASPSWLGGMVVTYAVPTGSTATVTGVLSNVSGSWKKTYSPTSAGRFKITSVASLAAGTYTFTLYLNGVAKTSITILKL